jgi:hypothetical protein
MTITIKIKPEVQEELRRRAAARGIDISDYAASLLESAAGLFVGMKILTLSELESTLRELAQFSHKTPLLPDEAFSRASLYQDHD